MAIKTVYEAQDEIPEPLKEHSKQDGDKWVIDVEDIEAHPQIVKLRNAYKAEQDKRKAQGQKLAEAEARAAAIPEDVDLEKWDALKDKKPGDADKQRQELKATLEKQWQAKVDTLEAQIKIKDQWLERTIRQDRLREGLVAAGVDPKLLPGAMALLAARVEIRQDGDNFRDIVDTDMGQ